MQHAASLPIRSALALGAVVTGSYVALRRGTQRATVEYGCRRLLIASGGQWQHGLHTGADPHLRAPASDRAQPASILRQIRQMDTTCGKSGSIMTALFPI